MGTENFIFNSCGIVELIIDALKIFFFASSFALLTADATSMAFPNPIPTWPFPSPTATTQLNLIDLPPVVALEILLIEITFSSFNSNSAGLINTLIILLNYKEIPFLRRVSAIAFTLPWNL